MTSTAHHSRHDSFLRSLQLRSRIGTAMRQSIPCSAKTIKFDASDWVRCARKGASVAHSAAAKKTRRGPHTTMVERVFMRELFYYTPPYFLKNAFTASRSFCSHSR